MKEAIVAILIIVALFVLLGQMGRETDDDRDTIEFWCYGSGGAENPTGQFWKETGRLFEEFNPDVRVKVVADIPHAPYDSLLTTRFVGGKAPDVFIVDDGFISELANEEQIHPLDDFIRNDPVYRQENFPPSMVRDGHVGGVCYSIPWYGGFGCIFYRTDIFADAGVTPPNTWAELLSVCRSLQQKAGLEYPFAFEPTTAFWMMPLIWQNGARIFSPDLKRVAVDAPEFVAAVQFVHDLIYEHKVVDPTLVRGTKARDLWSTGKVAMIMDGGWMAARYDKLYPQFKGKWEVAMLPAGKQQVCFYGGQHLVMNRRTKQPELAWEFMSFAANDDNQLRWAETGSPPANIKTLDLPAFKQQYPHFAIMGDVMKYGRNNPFAPFFTQIWYTRFQSDVLDVIMKDPRADIDVTRKTVCKAAAAMQKIVDGYWEIHDYDSYRRQGE